MANDISGVGRSAGNTRITGPQGPAGERARGEVGNQTGASAPGGDRVSLTGGAEALRQAESIAREASGVDPARVEAIRDAIAEGRYTIDTAKLAERLIADEKLLG
ncbi:MAG: flagellar biosynthesis anti-sigma factor FlgM [Pseudomonadales bacterium]|jgi:negative regulator of flagellin synthesis FlgM|nr:flagellar biosynthesis anti-sigma factor FlgM [Pseudomonadales bacterium]